MYNTFDPLSLHPLLAITSVLPVLKMAFKNSSTLFYFYFLFICGGLALPLVRREVPQGSFAKIDLYALRGAYPLLHWQSIRMSRF